MNTPPRAAYVLRSLVCGQSLNGEIDTLSGVHLAMARHLEGIPLQDRQAAFDGMAATQEDPVELIQAMTNVDLTKPAPAVSPVQFATLADIRAVMSSVRWDWEGWIPRAKVVGLAAYEGVGKTRAVMDLCRRVYLNLGWPDKQKMTLPKGTPSLWLCADGQHDELVEMAQDYDMSDSAVILPTLANDPYGNATLDDPETWKLVENAIVAHKPWLVNIDSLTYATSLDLCDQRSIVKLKQPLIDLAQRHQLVVLLSLHLALNGQVLGKRIKGITRTLLHLECPDSEKPERLRLWVEKSYGKKPPALGVTMGDKGSEYDFNPPSRPDAARKSGREPKERDKAKQFILDELAKQNDQIGNDLCGRCEKATQGSRKTFWRAVDALCDSGKLTTSGGPGTQSQTVLHLKDQQTAQTVPAP
jgi:hypothetical protein